ncbi:MAG: hypothetical protein HYV97_01165 [Bdellovibrio sp.]|nr:hypothetical protein [Bdellovibrio sp.]
MNTIHLILALALLSGCATMSPRLSDLSAKATVSNTLVHQSREQEKLKAKETRIQYETFLAANTLSQPLAYYQQKLKEQLDALTRGNEAIFTLEAAWAFPCVSDERVQAIAEAYLGLARLSLAENDAKAAGAHASNAINTILDRMISPVNFGPLLREAYELEELAYEKQGLAGNKLVARTNTDLIKDYEHSSQDETDRRQKARADLICRREMSSLDDIVDSVNVHRDTEAQTKFNAIGNAVMSGLVQVQQIVQARYGNSTGPSLSPQANSGPLWVEAAKTFSASLRGPGAEQDAGAQLGGLSFSQGILLFDKNAKTLDIIKEFARSAAALNGNDASVKKSSDDVLGATNVIATNRQGSGPDSQGLSQLAQSLSILQAQLRSQKTN